MRRLKTLRRPPIYPKTPGHLPCSSLTHPLPLSSRRPSVSFGGFGITQKLLPLLGYPNLRLEFDLSSVEALREDQTARVDRDVKLLDRGVLTINEVRRRHNLPDVPWGDGPGEK